LADRERKEELVQWETAEPPGSRAARVRREQMAQSFSRESVALGADQYPLRAWHS
jgi:hypothetical protein